MATYPYPFRVEYGPAYTGLAASVRYKAVRLDGAEVVAASGDGIEESEVLGNYYKDEVVDLPSDFVGLIQWSRQEGIDGTWDREEPVDIASEVAARAAFITTSITQSQAISGTALTVYRGDTWVVDMALAADLSDRTRLWFTVKTRSELGDSASLLQVEEADGLLYLNGEEAADSAGAGVTVTDAESGGVTVDIQAATTAALPPGRYSYDLQVATPSGVQTLLRGLFKVSADVTAVVA